MFLSDFLKRLHPSRPRYDERVTLLPQPCNVIFVLYRRLCVNGQKIFYLPVGFHFIVPNFKVSFCHSVFIDGRHGINAEKIKKN